MDRRRPTRWTRNAAIGASIGILSTLLIAVPSFAANCDSANNMCYFDGSSTSGTRLGRITSVLTNQNKWFNVPDNQITSGINTYPVIASASPWGFHGVNQLNIALNELVCKFPRNVSVNLTGTAANNVIDDLYWDFLSIAP